MCECAMIADGIYTPINIASDTMQLTYTDKAGKKHVLLEKFAMNITASKTTVKEIKRKGVIVGYQFNIE